MKTHILLGTMAILLAACDEKTNTTPTAQQPLSGTDPVLTTSVVVTDQTNGGFEIDARSDSSTFENKSDQPATFVFKAEGTWTWAVDGAMVGPDGVTTGPAGKGYYLPGAPSFALLAKRADNSYQLIGKASELVLRPHEVISFVMNDLVNGLADNHGKLKVSWTKK